MCSPVLITVYDRLLKLRECINSLLNNTEAEKTDLYIAIDFPYREEDEFRHKEVIEFCKKVKGFKSVNLIIRKANLGPQKNMSEAVVQLLNIYPNLIAMEDDNLVSPNFLKYMNHALEFYESDDRIYCITGYNYPVRMPLEYKNSSYLWTGFNGYGTGWWRSKFTPSYLQYNNFLEFINDKSKVEKFFNIANHILPIIFEGLRKGITYGDAAISYNLFLNNKYQLYPTVSKVRNTGYDGSGVHCGVNYLYLNQQIDDGTGKIEFINNIQPNKIIYEILHEHFKINEIQKILLEREIEEYKKQIEKKKVISLQNVEIQVQKEKIKTQMPLCPLTNRRNVVLEKQISCENIIIAYKRNFHVNVAKYFKGLKNIMIYRCLDSDYKFYYPFGIEGDSELYESLQAIPWYYMDWKWEYDIARTLIKSTDCVLEIGCGKGSFAERLIKDGISYTGLELNKNAYREAKEKALPVLNETIEEHVRYNFEKYDVVCLFQVLEHVASVQTFIRDSLLSLKQGGKLIVSVPNHDSFVGLDEMGILDMPPHHMGLWNEKSLRSLCGIFNIQLNKLYLEPLQSYHVDYYLGIMRRVIESEYGLHTILEELVRSCPQIIKGHTVLAEYTKIEVI